MSILINDMNILDNQFPYASLFLFDSTIAAMVMLGNMFEISFYFIIPSIVGIVLFAILFYSITGYIVETRALSIAAKSQLFSSLSEPLSGLVHIKLWGKMGFFADKFARKVNDIVKANIFNQIMLRSLETSIGFISISLLIIGYFIGIKIVVESDKNLYGVSINFLTQLVALYQTLFGDAILIKSLMTSYIRAREIIDLEP